MMLRITFLAMYIVLSAGYTTVQAQKAKFKNLVATCQKIRLPENYVAPEDRTYAIYTKGIYAGNINDNGRGIHGWTYSEDAPKVEAVVSLYGFRINPPTRSSQNKEKKDKDGKVTDRWTEYTYSSSAEGKGTLYVYGQSTKFVYESPEPSKAEMKKREREKEAKESLAANPFLTSDDVEEDEGESNIGEDSGLDGAKMPLAYHLSLDVSSSVSTAEHRTSTDAYNDYRKNQLPKLIDFRENYPTQSYNQAINNLNAQYGYSPLNYNMWLKEMKTDNHPEFEMWNQACEATKTLFKKFRYNQPIDDYQKQFDPIIKYFNDQLVSIDEGDKKSKGMRKAAFSNLINIMFYLDRYEEVSTICRQYESSSDLEKVARKMREKSNRQSALLAFHHVDSRHFNQLPDLNEEDFEAESDEEEDDEEDSQP